MRIFQKLGLVLALVLGVWGGFGYAQDFQRGLEAAQKGDFETALREWLPLAEQGNARAQFNLALMYDNGRGVTQDDAEAVRLYRLAAEQGLAEAQYNLGLMHENGEGVTKDYAEAVKWWRLAAEQGHAEAQNNLGVMYALGEGVIQDDVYAHMWGNIAASLGDENGKLLRDTIAKRMTPEQLAEAQRLARECVARDYQGC